MDFQNFQDWWYRLFVTGFMDLMVKEAVGAVREAVDCYILR